jgi:hypothetical protein
MDSPRETDQTPAVLDDPGQSAGAADRDLRDVLRHLVVADGDRADVSIAEVASAVEGSQRLLPELLGALEAETTAVRIGAAWALCAVADEHPETVDYLTERVAERVDDGDEPFEVGQVLSYLRGRYPGRAADAIDTAVADSSLDAPAGRGESRGAPAGGPDRPPVRTDGGTRTRDPGADTTDRELRADGGVTAAVEDLGGGRQVVRPDREDEVAHAQRAPAAGRDRPDTCVDVPESHPTHEEFDGDDAPDAESAAAPATPAEPASDAPRGETPTPDRDHRPETPETFASIGALSSFDRLVAVDEGVEDRYASAYRCRAVTEDRERGVAVRLFDRADEGDRLAFQSDLEDLLARWQALGEADCVVGVAEWGDRPRPWLATDPIEEPLAARDRPPVDEAVWHATRLAEAVGHLHRHGVVHGGIDPWNVVYPGDTFADLARPMLDNVGLMRAFRQYFDPREYLDPRYAAPEYFDDSYGSVDDATDVYQVGAVCYHLFTGRPPFQGTYDAVRDGILTRTLTPPSEVNDAVPAAVDSVIVKATAKEKIARYADVECLYRDLESVRDTLS